jgi:hypothetical protein
LYFASPFLADVPIDGELSCASIHSFCNMDGDAGSYVKALCPASCGLFEESNGEKVNKLNPESYRVTAIHYHAHLMGREMYATLLREETETDLVGIQKQIPSSPTMVKDLESRDIWSFDDQSTTPFDFDFVKDNALILGTEIKAGDKIQVSCVYDSTDRSESTVLL